jgi:penicillin-binding protein 1A
MGSRSVTGQLARVHLSRTFHRERQIKRMLREVVLTNWLSLWWKRDDIVDAYGATVYTGDNQCGLEAGAQRVFGQPVSELSTARIATLIAMIRAPNYLDPVCHPERALEARNTFLVQMRLASLLTESEAWSAIAEPLGTVSECAERKNTEPARFD